MSSRQISQDLVEARPVAVPWPQPSLPTRPRRSFWRSSSGRLLAAAIILFSLRTFVGEASVVPTGSMEGTILVGDHLFLDKVLYGPEVPLTNWHLPRLRTIHRGDIIVFRYPRYPEEAFLKRVVAVGGDRVEIRDAVVYINSRSLREPYAVHRRSRYGSQEQMAPVTVPEDSLFVMG